MYSKPSSPSLSRSFRRTAGTLRMIGAGDEKRLSLRSAKLKATGPAHNFFSSKHVARKLKIRMRFKPQTSGVIHRAVDDLLGIVDSDFAVFLILVTSGALKSTPSICLLVKTLIAKGVFNSLAVKCPLGKTPKRWLFRFWPSVNHDAS